MHHLVCSSNPPYHLYKKQRHLVRTPITITLQPDKMAVYQVAGSYSDNGFPNGGFTASSTLDNVKGMGYECLNQYLTHGHPLQIWREVNQTNHKPETVWYQGAYSTSGKTPQATYLDCESYLQLGAYHFSLPSKMGEAKVTQAKIRYVNGGAIQCYQSAATGSSQNRMLKGFTSEFSSWYFPLACLANISATTTPQTIASAPYVNSTDLLADSGTPRGARNLWDFASLGEDRPDGGIPALVAPPTKVVQMNDTTLAVLNGNNGCWIVPLIIATVNGVDYYRPQYLNSNNGWWACVSMWGLTLQVTIDD